MLAVMTLFTVQVMAALAVEEAVTFTGPVAPAPAPAAEEAVMDHITVALAAEAAEVPVALAAEEAVVQVALAVEGAVMDHITVASAAEGAAVPVALEVYTVRPAA